MARDVHSEKLHPTEADFSRFEPDDVATLLFVIEPSRVLLIRKKRGLGAGKISAPGGRLEPGESPEQAAIREVEEELGITPVNPEPRGVLSFIFTNGYKLRAHVFVAREFVGTLRETDEATPLWFPRNSLPFEEMWADDALWLPHVLEGRSIAGYFVFDEEKMLGKRLEILPRSTEPSAGFIALPRRTATRKLAARLGALLKGGELIVLSGPLGSGKTFFARALCGSLGIDERLVTSPTFSLVHEFSGRIDVAHADLYRLGGYAELPELGLDALRDEGSVLIVEWGEPYVEALGGDALIVSFALEPRSARLSAQGHRSLEILAALTSGRADGALSP